MRTLGTVFLLKGEHYTWSVKRDQKSLSSSLSIKQSRSGSVEGEKAWPIMKDWACLEKPGFRQAARLSVSTEWDGDKPSDREDHKTQENYGFHTSPLETIFAMTSAPGFINWRGYREKLYQNRDIIKNLTVWTLLIPFLALTSCVIPPLLPSL